MAVERLPSTGAAPLGGGQKFGATPKGDSAGLPWEGRTFDAHPSEFADDDGSTPAALAEALAGFRSGALGAEAVVEVFPAARVLIPLLAEAGEVGFTDEGKMVDKTQELSIVTVQAPDGRTVMPVFSSVEAMARWNPEARPVPSFGNRVALAAIDDGNDLVILDPTSPETEFGLRRPALWAIAREERYTVPWRDADVVAAIAGAAPADARVRGLRVLPGDPGSRLVTPETLVEIAVAPGLDQAALGEIVEALQAVWAAEDVIAERVDSLTVRFRAA